MIPLFRPLKPDMKAVSEIYEHALTTGQLTNFGEIHESCSRLLQQRYGGYWLPVSNGSVAIEIALNSLDRSIKRIAVPNFTFAATIQAIIRAGRIPVIIESKRNLELDISLLRKHSRSFDAILGVIPFGLTLDEQPLKNFSIRFDKPLIWDRAGAFPSKDNGRISTYSLHASKSMPIGEGGLIHFPNFSQYWEARTRICFGFDHYKNSYMEDAFNFKMDELRASVLYYFLKNFGEIQIRQQRLNDAKRYYTNELYQHCYRYDFKNHENLSLVVLNLKSAKALSKFLHNNGVTTRLYYSPLLEDHKAFKKYRFIGSRKRSLKNWIALPSDVSPLVRELIAKKIKQFYT